MRLNNFSSFTWTSKSKRETNDHCFSAETCVGESIPRSTLLPSARRDSSEATSNMVFSHTWLGTTPNKLFLHLPIMDTMDITTIITMEALMATMMIIMLREMTTIMQIKLMETNTPLKIITVTGKKMIMDMANTTENLFNNVLQVNLYFRFFFFYFIQ